MATHTHKGASTTTNLMGTFALKGTEGVLNVSGVCSHDGGVGTSYNGHLSASTSAPKIKINADIIPSITIADAGLNTAHNNLQPYQIVFYWQRKS